jgi:transglutaminase-like putative cysteine protease
VRRHVGSWLHVQIHTPARLLLQVAVADHAPAVTTESLVLTLDGVAIEAIEVAAPHRGRWHLIEVSPGQLLVDYRASIAGLADVPEPAIADEMTYLRASRYAESDKLYALAREEFAGVPADAALPGVVAAWVGRRLFYLSGWSRPTDGAVDTLLAGQGVCRDFAHLVTAVLRALDVPARTVAVYAPGLTPMDFHSVVEAYVGGGWLTVDATGLAPRSSLVRISTGRDSTDTAFLSSYYGEISMIDQVVTAVVDGELPIDDLSAAVRLR